MLCHAVISFTLWGPISPYGGTSFTFWGSNFTLWGTPTLLCFHAEREIEGLV